jgi:hypothetical protein
MPACKSHGRWLQGKRQAGLVNLRHCESGRWRIECQTQHAIESVLGHGLGDIISCIDQLDRTRCGTNQDTGLGIDNRCGDSHSH